MQTFQFISAIQSEIPCPIITFLFPFCEFKQQFCNSTNSIGPNIAITNSQSWALPIKVPIIDNYRTQFFCRSIRRKKVSDISEASWLAKLLATLLLLVSLLLLTSLLLLATHYHPNASFVASDSAVAYGTVAVGFPWVQAVLKVRAFAASLLLLLVLLLLTSQESLMWPPSLYWCWRPFC